MKIDRDAMAETAAACLGQAHFMWVAEEDGKVVGALAAVSQPSFWFRRNQVSVLLYNGKTLGLWRAFKQWVCSRSVNKVAVVELEPEAPESLKRFLKRLGFKRESTNLSYVRGE